ncbi:MAG TPA: class I SAM-dependent methyltransferase [Burkholderiales bacterium]|jgi:2-polyprenyl-3-methyl-5-hydroxy-6-metoxy-1,4-benzoquinol methylase
MLRLLFVLSLGFVASALARDVPYVPTPHAVVDKMLEVAQVGPNDVVYDLGCGDGRIVIAAAKKGARGVGIDIDEQRIREARSNAAAAGVADRVQFRQEDLFKTDFREATVVTMYLLTSVNMRLRPRLLAELKPGTRIVSHAFDLGDWKPLETHKVGSSTVYYWVVPQRQ